MMKKNKFAYLNHIPSNTRAIVNKKEFQFVQNNPGEKIIPLFLSKSEDTSEKILGYSAFLLKGSISDGNDCDIAYKRGYRTGVDQEVPLDQFVEIYDMHIFPSVLKALAI